MQRAQWQSPRGSGRRTLSGPRHRPHGADRCVCVPTGERWPVTTKRADQDRERPRTWSKTTSYLNGERISPPRPILSERVIAEARERQHGEHKKTRACLAWSQRKVNTLGLSLHRSAPAFESHPPLHESQFRPGEWCAINQESTIPVRTAQAGCRQYCLPITLWFQTGRRCVPIKPGRGVMLTPLACA